jgi:hypothetical protein
MKMNEVTSAQDQLDLLRLIIDNTWSSIKQKADAEVKLKALKPQSSNTGKTPQYKRPTAALKPKPLPKPLASAPLQPNSPQPDQSQLIKQIQSAITTPPKVNTIKPQRTTKMGPAF